MMEQKPVAEEIDWLGTIDAVVDDEFARLFIRDALKAERENAILECLQIAERWSGFYETADADTVRDEILALLSTNESKENECSPSL